ncbi:MAG: threonine synthase [bacterium]|nr:threonine synthase [bacterium]
MQYDTSHFDFLCYGCGATTAAKDRGLSCAACGEPFSVRSHATPDRAHMEQRPSSLWHYADLLPVVSREHVVTLNEGATPLVEAPRLAGRHGFGRLLLKNEMGNPTGSFKDRQISVGISHAREIGADTVSVVSSGNVACATAAYAARAGMRAVLLMHGHAAAGKLAQAAAYGAKAIRVDVPSASAVFDLCIEACDTFGWYHLSTAGMYEPYNVEGAKTIAYELYQQTGGDLPDWIVAPVGGGGLLGGIWRGLIDLQRLGLIDTLPRLAGVQATGCAPLVKAIDNDTAFLDTLKDPWIDPHTIAGGIADDIIFDGHTVLPAIRTTNGAALAVEDDAILKGELDLAAQEGLLCEPTCAVVIAALEQLPDAGPDTTVCCIVTGNGIKDLNVLEGHVPPPATIAPSLDALNAELGA